jgi:hypothetical protein
LDDFSSDEEAWFSIATETLRTRRYVMHEPTKVWKTTKTTSGFAVAEKEKGQRDRASEV